MPNDGLSWRIDAIGSLHVNSLATTNPLIEVAISPLRENGRKDPLAPDATDLKRQIVVEMSAVQIQLLAIGALFKNQRVVPASLEAKQLAYSVRAVQINQLEISETRVKQQSFGISADFDVNKNVVSATGLSQPKSTCGGTRLWPFFRNSQLTFVTSGNREYIFFDTELWRFYLTGSQAWNRLLITEADALERASPEFQQHGTTVSLQLRRDLIDTDSWLIARAHCSSEAHHAVQSVRRFILTQSANKTNQRFIRANFPFSGMTDLTVLGLPLDATDNSQPERFLVLRILSCSAAMPFERVIVHRDNDGRPPEQYDPNLLGAYLGQKRVVGDPENLLWQDDREPDKALASAYFSVLSPDRFAPLIGKSPEKPKKERASNVSGSKTSVTSSADGMTGGGNRLESGTGSHPAKSKDSESSQPYEEAAKEEIADAFTTFRRLLKYLHKRDLTVNLLRFNQTDNRDKANSVSRMLPNGTVKRAGWTRVNNEIRQVMIARISLTNRSVYLIELERRESERHRFKIPIIYRPNFAPLESGLLQAILVVVAQKKGVWVHISDKFLPTKFNVFQHNWNEDKAAAYHEEVFQMIVNCFENSAGQT